MTLIIQHVSHVYWNDRHVPTKLICSYVLQTMQILTRCDCCILLAAFGGIGDQMSMWYVEVFETVVIPHFKKRVGGLKLFTIIVRDTE